MKKYVTKHSKVFYIGIFILLLTGNLPIILGNAPIDSELPVIKASAEHSQIIISGNAELDAFCGGNGTTGMSWETAHIIGNFSIDTYDERESCFSIKIQTDT